ncbi:hypothetical protein KIV63_gp74 [Mycobacterium phage SWU2]|uniref:Uncharacterized protein n=1 Tax=Mycobacterium phage SWU2 TaxID=2077150 RepID=A0A2K9VI11_9CAUD|nr:hypothetical protein KIV63_gp74 [Mycobacterium phage SWU2]AUV61970.1 hypothetical protein JX_gp11 [Mycobacterium phage SWU2]
MGRLGEERPRVEIEAHSSSLPYGVKLLEYCGRLNPLSRCAAPLLPQRLLAQDGES